MHKFFQNRTDLVALCYYSVLSLAIFKDFYCHQLRLSDNIYFPLHVL